MRLVRAVALSALVLGACGAPASEAAPSSPRACAELLAQYRETVAARSDACASDAECVVYGGVDPDDPCGGATGAASGERLRGIASEMDGAGCARPGYGCPAVALRCVDGTCR